MSNMMYYTAFVFAMMLLSWYWKPPPLYILLFVLMIIVAQGFHELIKAVKKRG